jgi:hypothetical protein
MAEEKGESEHRPENDDEDWEDVQENETQDNSEPEKNDNKKH